MARQHGALTENIALLALCDSTFEPITENPTPVQATPEADGYKLSLQHEQRIVEAFAVLLANTDDPNTVGAICVEQLETTGLLVRTAVNSGEQEERRVSFERITRALESCSAERDEEAFFEEIVAACQPRLLGRLRSSHATPSRRTCKPPIIPKLWDGIKLLEKLRAVPTEIILVKNLVASLNQTFTKLEALSHAKAHSQPGRQVLKEILLSIELVLASTDIRALLEKIPKTIPAWSGHASQSLTGSLNRLAQYQSAARYLLRRACKDPNFLHLRIAEVPNNLFPESPHSSEPVSFATGLFSRSLAAGRKNPGKRIPGQLEAKLRKTRAEIQSCIHRHATKAKRVHAEIQLLFFYEASNAFLQPRVISSNKHACLLCNLFVKAHGKFHIRSCHGRLYPRWRIPLSEEVQLSKSSKIAMRQALDELNRQLEDRIRAYLCQPRLMIADPNESLLFIPGAITPSTSIVPFREVVHEETRPVSNLANTLTAEGTDSTSPEYNSSCPSGTQELQCLDRGSTIRVRVYPGSPARVHTRRIHLELTYEWAHSLASSASSSVSSAHKITSRDTSLLMHVECIEGGDLKLRADSEQMVDLCSPWISREVADGILFSDIGLVLKKRDEIVALRVIQ